MIIQRVDIQNFRRFRSCCIEFSERETIFVGANNSGKTSAMTALLLFLKSSKREEICTLDFTLSNWEAINRLGKEWVDASEQSGVLEGTLGQWLPTLDVWLFVEERELHHVKNIIPTLDWPGGRLGVRLVFCPKKIEDLRKDYIDAYKRARRVEKHENTEGTTPVDDKFQLPPKTLKDFLEQKHGDKTNLCKYFEVKFFTLDPAKFEGGQPQALLDAAEPLGADPFRNLLKIDIINAQRGFNDTNTGDDQKSDGKQLSAQLRRYYEKHLDPTTATDEDDVDLLKALDKSKDIFDDRLKDSFKSAIIELESFNYPGFSNPRIKLSSKVAPMESLKHDASVQFELGNPNAPENLAVPERYNGLGYQNLISMFFSLIRFRDEWMRVGKASAITTNEDVGIEPLHLVFIEEPEAHLHAQVQQVFIKRAYDILRNHRDLNQGNSRFSTQLVVSTHSSHIAHEVDFTCLRYFQRKTNCRIDEIPSSLVKNLSSVFGEEDETNKFATRYLRTTHCDLFFADAAIIVEGPAERMLVPNFIRRDEYKKLNRNYISLLEIGGSHAHRLRSLIETLSIPTLVITDLDSIEAATNRKAIPLIGGELRTGNATLKGWIPQKEKLDELIAADDADKIGSNSMVCVAYPSRQMVEFSSGNNMEAIPYTFEDALALSNLEFFRGQTASTGLLKKMVDASNNPTIAEATTAMFNALEHSPKKAEMALELVFATEPEKLAPPQYIATGLSWLQDKLEKMSIEYMPSQSGGSV